MVEKLTLSTRLALVAVGHDMATRLLWLLLPNATIFKWFHFNSQIFQRFSIHFYYNQLLDRVRPTATSAAILVLVATATLASICHTSIYVIYMIYFNIFSTPFCLKLTYFNCCRSWVLWHYKISPNSLRLLTFQPISGL